MNPFRADFDTRSAGETIAAGHALGGSLYPGLALILSGDLGAGKTTLVKGIAMAVAAADPDDVTSPTFTLMHQYRGRLRTSEEITLYHLDLYRLDHERQLAALGLDEIQNDPSAILLIEWGEKFPNLVAAIHGSIILTHNGGDQRHIAASWQPPYGH